MGRRLSPPVALVVFAAYVALASTVFHLIDPDASGAAWWPAAGVNVVAFLRTRRRDWPWLLLVVFAADVTANVLGGADGLEMVGWATANAVEGVVGALVLQAVFAGREVAAQRVGDVLRFGAGAAFGGPVVGALLGGLTGALAFSEPFLPTAGRWYAGDVMGILAVGPAALALSASRPRLRDIRAWAIGGGIVALTWVLFGPVVGDAVELPFLAGLALVGGAFVVGPSSAAYICFAFAFTANLWSALGHGPFVGNAAHGDPLLVLQFFLGTSILTALLVSAQADAMRDLRAAAADLRTETRRDALTGVGNRLALDDALGDLGACDGLSVLFVDLDAFKDVNDHYGHGVGDVVLRAVAARLVRSVRPQDVVARIGGDEFALLLPGTTREEGERLARRIQHRLDLPIAVDGRQLEVGASVGMEWAPDGRSPQLLDDADAAMYRVKELRRHDTTAHAR